MRYELTLTFQGRKPERGRCVKCGARKAFADDQELLCVRCVEAICAAAPVIGYETVKSCDEGGDYIAVHGRVTRGAFNMARGRSRSA